MANNPDFVIENGVLTEYTGPGGDVVIPEGITVIGDNAFEGCTNLTGVTIPKSVTEIGWGAFSRCMGLTNVTIPESVTEIRDWVFMNCKGLTEILVDTNNSVYHSIDGMLLDKKCLLRCPAGKNGNAIIPAGVTEIRGWAFSGCTGLTSVTIPEGVKEIGRNAFMDCTSLTSVTIPAGVTEIGQNAFVGCKGLTEILVDTNNSVYHSVDGMLLDKKYLLRCPAGKKGNVTIPEGVKEIEINAFNNCTGLTSVTIPEGVTEIGRCAFQGCEGLTSVTIPESVTKIGMYAFSRCTGLTSMTIPSGVTEIGECAFSGCTGLTSVTIPKSVTEIDKSVFEGCHPALVAPHIPIANFDKEYKSGACAGFAKWYLEKAELDEEIKKGYLKYIKGQKKKLCPLAVQHEELLRLMLAEKMFPRKDIDILLAECDNQNNAAAKAAVQDYINTL